LDDIMVAFIDGFPLSKRKLALLAVPIVASVFVLSVTWEFVAEPIVNTMLSNPEFEPIAEKWEFIITSTVFGLIALIVPLLVLWRLIEAQTTSHAAFRATIDSMAQGCAIHDADLNVIHYNAQFEKLFEFPPGFLYPGINSREIGKFRAARGDFGPGDVEAIVEGRIEHIKTSPPDQSHERTLANGKSYFSHRKPLPNGSFVTTFTDITERKAGEEALRESERRFRTAFENNIVAITLNRPDFESHMINATLANMLGYTPEEMQDLRLRGLRHPDEKLVGIERRAEFVDGKTDNTVSVERFIHKNGSVVWCETYHSPIFDDDGNLDGLLSIRQDITARKIAEEARRESEEKFRRRFRKHSCRHFGDG
jgi:PAS domain S-box-containing protein